MDENSPWKYKSDNKTAGSTATLEPAATQPPAGRGSGSSPPISWVASEFIEHKRGANWYGLLLLGTAALAAAIYFVTKEIFATGVIVALGIIVALAAKRKPQQITYELSSSGLRAGQKDYPYGLFRSFSIIQDGTLHSLHLQPLKRFMQPVTVYFDLKDEEHVMNMIGQHLPYEDRQLDNIDRLTRRLRF